MVNKEVKEEDIKELKKILFQFGIKTEIPSFKSIEELNRFRKQKIKNKLNNMK